MSEDMSERLSKEIWSVGFFLRNTQQEAIFANKEHLTGNIDVENSADFPEV